MQTKSATSYHLAMQTDSLPFNLLLFALAQVVALAYLRTGLPWRGIRLMMATWILADIALVARFVLSEQGLPYTLSLGFMQGYALLEFALYASGRLRRRMPGPRQHRQELIRQAFVHYLRNELDQAGRIYARLVRADPWDLQSQVGLASVHAGTGRPGRARRLLRSARGLAAQQGWSDLVEAALRAPPARARGV